MKHWTFLAAASTKDELSLLVTEEIKDDKQPPLEEVQEEMEQIMEEELKVVETVEPI